MEAAQMKECPYCHGIMELTKDGTGRPFFKCKNTLACGATDTDISSRKGIIAPKKEDGAAATNPIPAKRKKK